jgi:hypothetical protein
MDFVLSLVCVHGHAVERSAGCRLSRKVFIIAPLLLDVLPDQVSEWVDFVIVALRQVRAGA